jgi:type III secretion protein T
MNDAVLYTQIKAFLLALTYTQPRILAMFIAIPIFNRQLFPGLLRYSVAAGVGALVAPLLMPAVIATELDAAQILVLIAKEAFVGFVLGFLISIPFVAFEAVGFLIDNQRGASIAATLNPLTGNDTSPLGILFNQAFIVFFFVAGGFSLMLELLYESFRLWDVFSWSPTFRADSVPVMLDQLSRLVRLAMLLAAPAIVVMFLAEIGLALVSRFVPQLQVFFMAMPIKSALAILVLMLYMTTLFEYGTDQIQQLRNIIPLLNGQWSAPAGGAR